MAKGTVTVKILGDASHFQKETNIAIKSGESLGKKMVGVFGGMQLDRAAQGIANLTKDAIKGAVDMGETVSKAGQIFGSEAANVEKWADGASKSFGQSKQEALNAAAGFGNLFSQLGIGSTEALGLSKGMTELASDFASFHNAAPTDVIEAMSAAFRGEYDAVQKFVPTINAAAVEQKALAMTGKATTKELTLQEKALATQRLLMEGAGKAAGDFDRTSGSLANQQRIMKATLADVSAEAGTKLIPVLTKVATVGLGIIDWFRNLSPEGQKMIGVIAGVVAVGFTIIKMTQAWTAVQAAWNAVMLMNPIGLVVIAIAALVGALVYAYKNSEAFRDIVDGAFKAVAGAAQWLWGSVLKPVFGFIADQFTTTARQLWWVYENIIRPVFTFLADGASWAADIIGRVFSTVAGIIKGALNGLIWAINKAIGLMNGIKNNGVVRFLTPGPDLPDIPTIPQLASGGIVKARPGGTLALLGEGGRDEAVVPLGRGGGGMGDTFNFTINAVDGPGAERAVAELLERFYVRGGVITDGRGGTLRPT